MTHRHKNQTDEYQTRETMLDLMEYDQKFQRALRSVYGAPTGPTDSNHGSRTDSNTRGGKA